MVKKLVYAGPKSARNMLTNLSPIPARNPAQPVQPDPTYNSASASHWKWFSGPHVTRGALIAQPCSRVAKYCKTE